MKLYKLTDQNGCTKGKTQWGENVTHSISDDMRKPVLCSDGILHAYKDVNLALLLNPIHAEIFNFRLWDAEGEIIVEDFGKCGCYELTTLKELDLPEWYNEESIKRDVQLSFAILCAESVLKHFEAEFPGDARPRQAIDAAKAYLKTKSKAARAAANADADAAADAAARAAAHAAAYAAAYAAKEQPDFVLIAKQAIDLIGQN